jgi:hypothetical protein
MNELRVSLWPINQVIPFARNARKIPASAVAKVAASIKEFGWRQPIVVDREGVIICGHTRLLAARKLGLEQVPVHVAENLSPAQVRAYRLMDNRSHEEAESDMELLAPDLEELRSLDMDLKLTGFDPHEIDFLLANSHDDEKANTVPPVPEEPVTKAGDLWLCDGHRLLCGDATQQDAVSRVCGPAKPFHLAARRSHQVLAAARTDRLQILLAHDTAISNTQIRRAWPYLRSTMRRIVSIVETSARLPSKVS